MGWTILVEGHQRNISAKLYWHWSSGFWQEDFWSFLYRYIGKISPPRPCFLTIHDGLNNLGRGFQKKHFCQIEQKSVQGFLTRIFKVFYMDINYRENKSCPLAAMSFEKSWLLEQSWTAKGTFLPNYIVLWFLTKRRFFFFKFFFFGCHGNQN